jgi:hypothetical protein
MFGLRRIVSNLFSLTRNIFMLGADSANYRNDALQPVDLCHDKVLVTSSPNELSVGVGQLCDREPNHDCRTERAGSIGDMLACALVDHDNSNSFSNRPLKERLDCMTTTPEHVAEAMRTSELCWSFSRFASCRVTGLLKCPVTNARARKKKLS